MWDNLRTAYGYFDTPYVGARAVGMGGAQTAAPADGTAQFHNPAALSVMYGDRDTALENGYGAIKRFVISIGQNRTLAGK